MLKIAGMKGGRYLFILRIIRGYTAVGPQHKKRTVQLEHHGHGGKNIKAVAYMHMTRISRTL
jgi:hypothetical protein